MIRGYARISRNTGVSFSLWAIILFLPVALFVGACYVVCWFFASPNYRVSTKLLVLLLDVVGVTLAVLFVGHCDRAGLCSQTTAQGDLAALGAAMIVVSLVVVVVAYRRA